MCGSGTVAADFGRNAPVPAAAEVARFRRACRSSQGLPLAASCERVPTRNGEAEKTRQRWIAWSVHRGPREIGRRDHCVRDAGRTSGFRGDHPRLHFFLLCKRPWETEFSRRPRRPYFWAGANGASAKRACRYGPGLLQQARKGERMPHNLLVIAGLDPAIHDEDKCPPPLRMDHRVKPGDDEVK